MKPNPKPESKTQKRKKYIQTVSRKRKYTSFELELWKKQDEEEQHRKKMGGSWTVRLYATFPKFNNKRLKPLSLELKQRLPNAPVVGI